MRPINSSYDRQFADATERLLAALRGAGHEVETPVTGHVWVDGHDIEPDRWDTLATGWDGTEDGLEAIVDGLD